MSSCGNPPTAGERDPFGDHVLVQAVGQHGGSEGVTTGMGHGSRGLIISVLYRSLIVLARVLSYDELTTPTEVRIGLFEVFGERHSRVLGGFKWFVATTS